MGKKQHSKDRMYLTKTEWATEWGGAKSKLTTPFKRLPFYCCAYLYSPLSLSLSIYLDVCIVVLSWYRFICYLCSLTFTPFEDPVCTPDGSVFDIMFVTFLFFAALIALSYHFAFLGLLSIAFFDMIIETVLLWLYRHIRPYIRKYGKHPVTGAPLKTEDLITLNFHKNSDGKIFYKLHHL